MRIPQLALAAVALALSMLLGACAAEEPAGTGFILPAGEPDEGREAFVELRCTSCHTVESEPDLPEPVSANRGPSLDTLGPEVSREHLATSIISPSHEVAPPRDSPLSHMGSFREAMTVQQLLDLVAWLEELNR